MHRMESGFLSWKKRKRRRKRGKGGGEKRRVELEQREEEKKKRRRNGRWRSSWSSNADRHFYTAVFGQAV